jgi:hypothetical protein
MHATQPRGEACPEPTRRVDGKPETEADRRFFALREAGWTGWIDLHGYATDVDGVRLDLGTCQTCGNDRIPVHPVVDAAGVTRVICIDPGTCTRRRPIATTPIPADPVGVETTPARVLRNAALYLERHGWIQGAYYDGTSGVFTPAACLVGAIGMVCYGGPVDAPAQHFDDPGFLDFEEAVLHLDRYLLVEDGSESYEFNDAKGRRVADVTYVLRQAADTSAEELIDAIRVIDARNADMAALAQLLTPCGIWGDRADQPTPVDHVDYPHTPGTLYDCPACEASCFCTDGFQCVHCALAAETADGDTTPGGDA